MQNQNELLGTVFNIQHFSIHDGPGIRTSVFLKGCPLRCKWCANPESQKSNIEMGWTAGECIGCKSCVQQLQSLECRFDTQGKLYWNTAAPFDPQAAEKICPSKAFHVIGKKMTVKQVLEEVTKDEAFFKNSGGGLTISGGEPLAQAAFTTALLNLAGQRGIHRAVETTLYNARETVMDLCQNLDLLIMDVKTMNSQDHLYWTGVDNRPILENLQAVRREFPGLPLLVRTPVVPGVNDTEEALGAIVAFLNGLGQQGQAPLQYEMLKYHQLGIDKYRSLGRPYEMGDVVLEQERFASLKAYAKKQGKSIQVI